MTDNSYGKIFVSYARADSQIAQEVVDALRGLNLAPWIDDREVRPGESFVERINEALERASYLLLLLSSTSLGSRWVTREWMAALADEETVLLPLLVEPCKLPPLLRDILYIDLSANREKGIEELVDFFRKETVRAVETKTREVERGLPETGIPTTRREIRLVAKRCMDETAFTEFLFDNEIDGRSLGGNSLHEKVLSLLHLVDREGLLEHFVVWLIEDRQRCVAHQLSEIRKKKSWHVE